MLLTATDIAEFVKERHFRQVRGLSFTPKLAVIHASSDPATDSYLKVKSLYAAEIGVEFVVSRPLAATDAINSEIKRLNADTSVHGIIVQLPLPHSVDTDLVIKTINPFKDIDGLGPKSNYDPATATGILWLLAGYNIDYKGKKITVVGQGRLVGQPLSKILEDSGGSVIRCDINTQDLQSSTLKADIIVAATGQKDLIKPGMVRSGAVVIDAGGDVDAELLNDQSLKITPPRGGVGPMTVAALFDNLLRAAQKAKPPSK